MNQKRAILTIAKNQLEKELEKKQKAVAKHSQKLASVNMDETTLKSRANLRINLDTACESRDFTQRRLEYLEEWMQEVK